MNASNPDDITPDEIDTDDSQPCSGPSAFIPLILLSLSFGLFLIWQIRSTGSQNTLLKQNIEQRKGAVLESQQMQQGIVRLIYGDLLEVAKDDNDARLILYNNRICDPKTGEPIVRMANPPGAPAASGTTAASGTK